MEEQSLARDDTAELATEYIREAVRLLSLVRRRLGGGGVPAAAGRVWRAALLAVKAYVAWVYGETPDGAEPTAYLRRVSQNLGRWVYGVWAYASEMKSCSEEEWCGPSAVDAAAEEVGRLVDAVFRLIYGRSGRARTPR